MNELMNAENGITITSVEISNIINKAHTNVLRDIRKIDVVYKRIGQIRCESSYYTNIQNKEHPMFILTKMQTMDLMTGYSIELRIKVNRRWKELEEIKQTNVQIQPMSQLDIIEASTKILRDHEKEIKSIKKDVHILKSITTTRPNYFAVVGYASLINLPINLKQAAYLGRQASKVCKERNIIPDSMPDPRFGKVNLYPIDILEVLFDKFKDIIGKYVK